MKFTKETLRRVLRTFMQAFVASVCITITTVDFSAGRDIIKAGLISVATGGLAAGIAAVMNLEVNDNEDMAEKN